tara:strand:+ start:181 stop:1134 length:954 start_codon:yes stop_codon:yes gene_type:complete
MKSFLSLALKKLFHKRLNRFLSKRHYLIIFRNGSAIGDHVYLSSIIAKIHNQNNKKIILFTNYFDLFLNNPKIYKLFKFKANSIIWFFLESLKSDSILEFHSIHATYENHYIKKKYFLFFHKKKKIHLGQAMSSHFNLDIDYKNLKNEFFFSKKELKEYEDELELPLNFSLIQSTSKTSFTKNKEWKLERMQSIVDHFSEINWIQIGLSSEPRLKNCIYKLDLDLRKLAFVIFKCDFLVTYEGLFNHLASSFNKKNFLIHTGFLPIEAFNYSNNIVIEANSKMKCYPCYDIHCESHTEDCLKNLTVDLVINKIKNNL